MASKVFPQWPVLFVTVLTIVSVTVPHVSDAAGASKLHELLHSTVLSAMHVMVGLVLSITVTFWLHSAKLPQASVARHVRMASKVLPQWPVLFVTVLTIVSVTVPHVSDAAGASKLHELVHSTVLSAMHVMVGLVVS